MISISLGMVAGSAVGLEEVPGLAMELEMILKARLRGLPLRGTELEILLLLLSMSQTARGPAVEEVVAISTLEWELILEVWLRSFWCSGVVVLLLLLVELNMVAGSAVGLENITGSEEFETVAAGSAVGL